MPIPAQDQGAPGVRPDPRRPVDSGDRALANSRGKPQQADINVGVVMPDRRERSPANIVSFAIRSPVTLVT